MFHIYPICIKCQGCHATSFQLIVFTADISGHSYQRAPSPTAPCPQPHHQDYAHVSKAGRGTLNRWSSWASQEQLMPCLRPSCVYHVKQASIWAAFGTFKEACTEGCITLSCPNHLECFCVGKQVRSFPLPTQSPERCVWFPCLRGTPGSWVRAK